MRDTCSLLCEFLMEFAVWQWRNDRKKNIFLEASDDFTAINLITNRHKHIEAYHLQWQHFFSSLLNAEHPKFEAASMI